MPRTQQRLSAQSEDFTQIQSGEVLNVQAGLIFKDGSPATPWFVDLKTTCPYLQVLERNSDGTFDVWNPSTEAQTFGFIAHHLHSIEQEPIPAISPTVQASTVPAPNLCPVPGGNGGGDVPYLMGDYYLSALEIIEAARTKTATTILTDEDPGALQAAITAASSGDVIEIQTDVDYSPITIPAGKELVIRAGDGFTPGLTGQNALNIDNGVQNVVVAGLSFNDCSTAEANYRGAQVCFSAGQSRCKDVYFDRCNFNEVQSGSGVGLAYHWASYADPPQYNELSYGLTFSECNFFHAQVEGVEGGNLLIRGFRNVFLHKCIIDGDNNANGSRGCNLQSCQEALIFECESFNHTGNGGEAYKFDVIPGSTPAVITTGHIVRSIARDSVEGIDIDDFSHVAAFDNFCHDNETKGISVDDSAKATLHNNTCYNNESGILVDAGGEADLENNHCYANPGANYATTFTVPFSNVDGLEVPTDTDITKKRMGMIPNYLLEHHEAGEMFLFENIVQTFFEIPGWYPIRGTWAAGLLRGFNFNAEEASVNNFGYLFAPKPGWYQVDYSLTTEPVGAPVTYEFAIFIGTTQQQNTTVRRAHTNNDVGSIGGGGMIYIDPSNISQPISVQAQNLVNSITLTVIHANVRLTKIQG
jgi:parallel beta-helix repeat protein